MKTLATTLLLTVLAGTLFSQSVPTFEAADVHPSPHGINSSTRVTFGGGRYVVRRATMLDLIAGAYGVDAASVLGGPSWLEADRFDITAKTSANTSTDALKSMLRTLLSDRFDLKTHPDTKTLSAYVLTVVKHNPQVKEADRAGPKGCQNMPPDSPILNQSFSCHNITMADFAHGLRSMGVNVGYIGDVSVLNQTGLNGAWDFTLKYSTRAMLASSDDGISLFDAIDKQMGMKLDLMKSTAPVLVVDSVNRTPTDNSPDVSLKLPTVKMEFEVADIKPSEPDTKESFSIQPGGRVNGTALTLRELVQITTDVTNDGDDMLLGPKWIDSARFNILAKPAADAGNLTTEDIRQMLRALLIDRFKIVTHKEDQPVNVYLLTAPKPKLKTADESNRSACRSAGAASGGPSAAGLRTYNCQNMTMALFATTLQSIATAYFDHPLVEQTGLDGAYDFSLTFSERGIAEAAARSTGGATPSDPTGAISLSEALDKLGLKLALQKHSMPVTVIDHVEQMPTEN